MQRQKMSVEDRAKIFTPFNPLKGFQEALREKERAREASERAQLSEDRTSELQYKLTELESGDLVAVTRYSDGSYEVVRGVYVGVHAGSIVIGDALVDTQDVFDIEKL